MSGFLFTLLNITKDGLKYKCDKHNDSNQNFEFYKASSLHKQP